VLRPTIEGDCQINNFAIGTYEQFTGDANWTNNATISDYIKPEAATLYNFPVLGFSFDPTVTASTGNASSFTDSTGATIASQSDPSWRNPQNLFDNNVTTRAEILKSGEDNALYVQMNGFLGTPPPADSLEITGFTMNIRGVTQSAIYEHKLRFQIVENDRATVLFETADDTPEAASIQVPNDSSGIFPTQNGAYNIYFKSTQTNVVTYGQMKDAFIKVWAEELPRSYNFAVSAPDSTAYSMSGSDRTGNITGNNPTIEIKQGDSITFNVNATGHPLHLKTAQTTGTGDQIVGVTNNGTDSGSVSYTFTTPGTYYYQCEYHSSMTGTITITT
jgi:plastocyanin